MERDGKGFMTRTAETVQKGGLILGGVSLLGSAVGLIPINVTMNLLGFDALAYLGAEVMKDKKK